MGSLSAKNESEKISRLGTFKQFIFITWVRDSLVLLTTSPSRKDGLSWSQLVLECAHPALSFSDRRLCSGQAPVFPTFDFPRHLPPRAARGSISVRPSCAFLLSIFSSNWKWLRIEGFAPWKGLTSLPQQFQTVDSKGFLFVAHATGGKSAKQILTKRVSSTWYLTAPRKDSPCFAASSVWKQRN
jgi:hypothetical protein